MTGPVITTTFREEGASELSNAFDRVGQSSEDMGESVDRASNDMSNSGSSFDTMSEGADTAETRFTGFYDTIGGTRDALAAWNDESLSTTDKLVALGQAGADLAGGLVGFVIPAIKSVAQRLMATSMATWALNAAQIAWNATTKAGAAAMAILNTVMRANPVLFIVGLIATLVGAFILLWNKSEGFRNFWKRTWKVIQDVARTARDIIVAVFRPIVWVIERIVDGVKWLVDRIKDAITWIKKLSGATANITNPFGSGSFGGIPGFHTGGVVPGIPGQEVLAVLQGGETVNTGGQGGGGGSKSPIIASGTEKALAELINNLIRRNLIKV